MVADDVRAEAIQITIWTFFVFGVYLAVFWAFGYVDLLSVDISAFLATYGLPFFVATMLVQGFNRLMAYI